MALSWRATLWLALALQGCATAVHLPDVPPPERIPERESRAAQADDDPDLLIELGAAYLAADRAAEAIPLLERARALAPERPNVAFFLGRAFADVDRASDAVEAYRTFALALPQGAARDHIEGRVRLLERRRFQAEVRDALRQEATLRTRGSPDASTVAVFPFAFSADDESLRPLARALSAILATDLAQSPRLRVVERQNVQALLDEVALGESSLVDRATAARGGYLIGAGRIVQGSISGTGDQIELTAAVVLAGDADPNARSVAERARLDELFAVQTRLSLEVFEALGVALTEAERAAVTRRPTQNLQALLAFGQGLESEARGDFAGATRSYSRALALDPDFREAAQRADDVDAADRAQETDFDGDLSILETEVGSAVVDAVLDRAGLRDPLQEALGIEGLGRGATRRIRFVFPRPGRGG